MHFQKHRSPTPYLNRRDQRRLLGMVLMLAMVVVGFALARQPQNWAWFFMLAGDGEVAEEAPALEELDFRVSPEPEPLPPDTLYLEPGQETESPSSTEPDASRARVPPGLFADVEDNRLGLPRPERPAVEYLLQKVRVLPPDEAERAAHRDVAFTVLMLKPQDYRGALISLSGVLRQLEPLELPRADGERETVHEAWLFTRDSGNNPVRVLLAEPPGGLRPGRELAVEVRVTGYFFKRYGYVSRGGQHVAPMLIARTLRPVPPTVPEPAVVKEDLRRYFVGLVLIVGAAFATIAWWFALSDRRFIRSRSRALAESRLDARREDLDALRNVETSGPEQVFEALRRESE